MTTNGWTDDEDLDMDNASTEPPPPLEDGLYCCTIAEASAEQTREGKPCVKIALLAMQSHAGEDVGKRKMFDTLPITRAAAWKVKQVALSAGVEPPKRSNYEVVSEFAESLVGQQVWCKTVRKQFGDKFFARPDRYFTQEGADAYAAGEPSSEVADESGTTKRRSRRKG